jgi:hypothetical protein
VLALLWFSSGGAGASLEAPDALASNELVHQLRGLCDQPCAELMALGAPKFTMRSRQVATNEVLAGPPIELHLDALTILGHRRTELWGHRARGIGVAEQLTKEELAGDDRPALSLTCQTPPPQGLIGRRRATEGLRESDPARAMGNHLSLIELECLAA